MASHDTFAELLRRLSAEHDKILEVNAGLSMEIAALRMREQQFAGVVPGQAANGDSPERHKCDEHGSVVFEDSAVLPDFCNCALSTGVPVHETHALPSGANFSEHAVATSDVVEQPHTSAQDNLSWAWHEEASPVEVKKQGSGPLPPVLRLSASPRTVSDASMRTRARRSTTKVTSSPSSGHQSGESSALSLWPLWEAKLQAPLIKDISNSTNSMLKVHLGTVRIGNQLREQGCLQRLVVGPNTKKRIAWDFLSIIVVGYDVLTVPLTAFSSLDSPTTRYMSLATTVFWTVDMPISFLSGFYVGGVVEMRPRVLAKNYLTHWFLPDLIILATDWLLLLVQSGFSDIVGIVRITKTLRLSGVLRLFRLLRVMKVPALVDDMLGNFQSEGVLTALSICRSMALIGLINHFIACGWYAISSNSPTADPRWISKLEDEGRGVHYRYLTALHWSLTQFTPASMEVSPRNSLERLFAISVLFSAMVTFSTFVSSITTAMTNLRRINAEKSKQREQIRRYVNDNELSIDLGNKISAFLRTHNFMAKPHVHEEDIQVFKVLPEVLRLQLHWEVYSFRLMPHPLFHHYGDTDEQGIFEICHICMCEVSIRTGQELFTYGGTAAKMFFLQTGVLEYYDDRQDAGPLEVGEGTLHHWYCEVVLWMRWEHRGRLCAVAPCEFVAMDSARFRKSVSRRRPMVLNACREYAKAYRERVLKNPTHCVDIGFDFDETQELVHFAFDQVSEENYEAEDTRYTFRRMWRSWSPRNFIAKIGHMSLAPRRCNTL